MFVSALCHRLLVPFSPSLSRISILRKASSSCHLFKTTRSQKETGQNVIFSSPLESAGIPIFNARLDTLRITAAFYNGDRLLQPAQPLAIDLPSLNSDQHINESPINNGKVHINPPELRRDVEIADPPRPELPSSIVDEPSPDKVKKWAQRMVRIRKKKMKVHRRKRLWKRMWTIWKKKFFGREKKRELEFRQRLIDAVKAAERFDAKTYVDLYLEDANFEFIPKTYKGRSKPKFVIEELLERDKRVAERHRLDRTNLITGKMLIEEGETVDDFIKRNWK